MQRRTILAILVVSALMAVVLTAFYSIHEELPRLMVFVKRGGRWRLAAQQDTRVAQDRP